MRGMTHPPAFDGLQAKLRRSLTRERQSEPGTGAESGQGLAAEFTDHDTLLAAQLAERLSERPRVAANPGGDSLMARIAQVDDEPQTVRAPSFGIEYDDQPSTAPPNSVPHFAVRPEPAAAEEWTQEPEGPGRINTVPARRLVAAMQAQRRQRFFSGLRNFASWIVTVGVAGAIIGAAALVFLGGRPAQNGSESVAAIEAAIPTPTAPPTLIAVPAPAERPVEPPQAQPQTKTSAPVPPAPRSAAVPASSEKAPSEKALSAPAKLVKPIKQVQPGAKKGTAKSKAVVKAGSPSPGRAPAARASAQKDQVE